MVQALLTTIEKIYNSIKYNGFYILMSLLFPLIIWKFDAGTEILVSMTETAFWPNIVLSIAAFAAMAFSVWCIPTLAIKMFQYVADYRDRKDKQKNEQLKLCLYKQLVFAYNGLDAKDTATKQADERACISTTEKRLMIPMRYFAIAPWILFILTGTRVFFENTTYVWGLIAVVFLVLSALIWFVDRYKAIVTAVVKMLFVSRRDGEIQPWRFTYYAILVFLTVIGIWIYFLLVQTKTGIAEGTREAQYGMIIAHLICLMIFYVFIIYMENEKFDRRMAYKISNISFKSLIIFIGFCIGCFYFFNEAQLIEFVSPVNVIIIIATAFIVLFEFLFTSQHLLINIIEKLCSAEVSCLLIPEKSETRRLRGYRYILFGLLFVLMYQFFFSSLNNHRIRVTPAAAKIQKQRLTITQYFDKWLAKANLSADSVVYLVSGQGGGSRAAAHFFMTMAMFEKNDPNFLNKVFSISTASGSTSGAEMFLASKYYGERFNDTSFILKKGIQLYGKNYMSSAFFGLMMGDGIEYFTSFNSPFVHDRNYHLQKEELAGFNAAFGIKGNDFFERDFMFPYSDTARHWPLFLINTTVVDYGVRGVFSPVKTDFSLARDLYGEFVKDNCNDKKDLPLVACVNQSQAFPLLSAYNYIECTGRMADGGIVENTGCATTLEVYEALRMYCNNTNRKGIRIVCLNLYNSSLKENFNAPFKKASMLNTVTAVANSPFSGSQFYAYKNLSKKIAYLDSFNLGINRGDKVMDFGLDTAVTLTRTLSKQSVKKIFSAIKDSAYEQRMPGWVKKSAGQPKEK